MRLRCYIVAIVAFVYIVDVILVTMIHRQKKFTDAQSEFRRFMGVDPGMPHPVGIQIKGVDPGMPHPVGIQIKATDKGQQTDVQPGPNGKWERVMSNPFLRTLYLIICLNYG